MKEPRSKEITHINIPDNNQKTALLESALIKNLQHIKNETDYSPDVAVRQIKVEVSGKLLHFAIIFVQGITDHTVIDEGIIKSIIENSLADKEPDKSWSTPFQWLKERALSTLEISDLQDKKELFSGLFGGSTIILCDGFPEGVGVKTAGGMQRGIEESQTQPVVRGPKDAFNENIQTNIALLRKRIKTPDLRLETRKLGTYTKTDIALMYIKGIARDEVIKEVKRRLDGIETDSILEGSFIEEFIQDKTFTPFPLMSNTDRPDIASASLLEGQFIILVDGSPFVLIAPMTFFSFLHVSEDYYQWFGIAIFVRWIRYICFFISLTLPSLYVAITTFHKEMIPTRLLISLAAQREGVPFPAFVEALLMELTFEILREAGLRMPRAIGSAISIVGSFVIGQSAVEAGLVSPAMVIVVSLTAISNFTIPLFNMGFSIRILRFPLMFLSASFGLYGVVAGLFFLMIHLVSLKSFGLPYLLSAAPMKLRNQKDLFIRLPRRLLKTRPSGLSDENKIRQSDYPSTE